MKMKLSVILVLVAVAPMDGDIKKIGRNKKADIKFSFLSRIDVPRFYSLESQLDFSPTLGSAQNNDLIIT